MKTQPYRVTATLGCLVAWIILAVPSARLQPIAVGQGTVNLAGERQYITILKSKAPVYEKAAACRQLALVGTAKSVPVLAGLLDDEILSDYARLALEPIEDPSVDKALRLALDRLDGKLLAGVINSIGARGDAGAVDRLSELAADPKSPFAGEAVAALGRIATDGACESILRVLSHESAKLRTVAADACLAAAENRTDDAVRLYDAVRQADVPGHLRASGTYGAIMARGERGTTLLVEQLRTYDPQKVEIALLAARRLPGSEVTHRLVDELKTSPPILQVLLIKVLVDRKDPIACESIKALAASDETAVSVESLTALGKIGDASAVPILIEAAGGGRARSSAARMSLRQLKGDGVDEAIIEAMKSAKGYVRVVLIEILADRRCEAAIPALLDEAASVDRMAAVASLKALTALARSDDVPALIELLVNARSTAVRTQAQNAVVAAASPDKRTGDILKELKTADSVEVRSSLLRVLGRIGGDDAFAALRNALNDADEEIRDTAVRALAAWPDSEVLDTLSEISQNTANNTHRVLAFRGYVRLLAFDKEISAEEKVGMYKRAMSMARSAEEKKLVLAGLAGAGHRDALEIIFEYADEPQVQNEAVLAALKVAQAIADDRPGEAKKAATKIQRIAANPQVRKQAEDLIKKIDRE